MENRNAGLSHEILVAKYNAHVQYFISDNNRIWNTAGIFISASTILLAIAASSDNIGPRNLFVMALMSIVLSIYWLFLAERHKTFQKKHEIILDEIERLCMQSSNDIFYSKIYIRSNELKKEIEEKTFLNLIGASKVRYLMSMSIIVSWIIIYI